MTLGSDHFQSVTSQIYFLKDFPFVFHLFWHNIVCLIYQESGDQEINRRQKDKEKTTEEIDTDQFVFKTNNFSVDASLQLCHEISKFFRWMNIEKSKEEKTITKSIVFLEAKIILYRLCQRLGNRNCLFQSLSNKMKFIKKVQLDSKVSQAKISRKSLRFL